MYRNPKLNNLGDVLKRNARQYPQREALVTKDVRLSWEALNKRVNCLANGLLNAGIQHGDPIAVVLLNCHEWVILNFAILKIGAIFVPINYRLSPKEVSDIINDSGAKILFYSHAFSSLVQGSSEKCPSLDKLVCVGYEADEHFSYGQMLTNNDQVPEAEVGLNDVAYIAYTGGTTGLPKGAVWLHQTLLSTIQDVPYSFEVAFKSKELIPVPSFAGGVIVQILNAIYCTTTLVFIDFEPLEIFKAIENEQVELMASSAVPLFMLANHPEAKKYDVSSLKRIFYGGGAMSLKQIEKVRNIFSCELQQGYGSTETLINITKLNPYDHQLENKENIKRLGSAGRVNKGVDIRLVDDNYNDVVPGDVGEIAVKSESLFVEYWNRPEETKMALKDGWYYTSDMGYMDDEGYVFIVDRKNDMIKTGGLSVYPAEVEGILVTHPSVAEAAVISVPDEKWGERIVAIVVLKESGVLTDEKLKQYCRDNIGGFKVPKNVYFSDKSLPRTVLGKLNRRKLRDEYRHGHE